MTEVVMPTYGMAMTEGEIVVWLAQPGDRVAAGQPIAEIDTDKVTVQLECPVSGVLGPHLRKEGDSVPVGTPLVRIYQEGDVR
jgi:pyruvate dehydrogenase E2 component (dihydrolipoamide acetyltransferase)